MNTPSRSGLQGATRLSRIVWTAACWCAVAGPPAARAEWGEGFAEPYEQVRVAAAESGLLTELLASEGSHVEAGQLLGSLDSEVLFAERKLAEVRSRSTARRDAARAELTLRTIRVEKLEKLLSTRDANQDEVERARADARVAEANLAAAEEERTLASLDLARLDAQIERRKIRSPVAGTVVTLDRKRGEFVTMTEPQVVTVVNTKRLIVRLHVPHDVAAALQVGDNQPLVFREPSSMVEGKVEFVSPLTEVDSNTVRVHIVLENPQGKIRSGARCRLATSPEFVSRRAEPLTPVPRAQGVQP